MTVAAVQAFLQQASTDSELQKALGQAIEAENDREAVTTLAKANGFDFTAEELGAEIQKAQADFQARQAAGELSDEELEAVAGGETMLATAIGATISIIASGSVGFTMQVAKW